MTDELKIPEDLGDITTDTGDEIIALLIGAATAHNQPPTHNYHDKV